MLARLPQVLLRQYQAVTTKLAHDLHEGVEARCEGEVGLPAASPMSQFSRQLFLMT